jgi:hypothetical protein
MVILAQAVFLWYYCLTLWRATLALSKEKIVSNFSGTIGKQFSFFALAVFLFLQEFLFSGRHL